MARRYEQINNRKPLIIICSEGGLKSSEYYYFRNFKSRDLRIQFSTGNSTDPKGMLKDLLKYINNEDIKSEDNVRIFLVLDTDLSERRINEIKSIEQECIKNNIEIIISSPTFEIWYLMHFKNNKLKFNSSKDVKNELTKILKFYKESMNLYNNINDKTDTAITLARQLEDKIIKNKEDIYKANPYTGIYKIVNTIKSLSIK